MGAEPTPPKKKSRRGFAAMSLEQRRAIASKGGKAAQAKGTGHRYTHEEAVAAGRKGGKATQAKGTLFDVNKHNKKRKRRRKPAPPT